MFKHFYLIVLLIFIPAVSGSLLAQIEDDGMNNDFHKENVGKAIFAPTSIFINFEKKAGITNEFTWGGPIYCMFYFKRGMNNEYNDLGWDYSGKTYYLVEVAVAGKPAGTVIQEIDKKWTNIQACFFPKPKDKYEWKETKILPDALAKLAEGKYDIGVKVYPSNADGSKKGSVICEGVFSLNYKPLPEPEAVNTASLPKPVFNAIQTRNTVNPDIKEWIIKMDIGTGVLKTRWNNDDSWNDWLLDLPDYSAGIKTRFGGSDGWQEWFYEDATDKIIIKPRYTSGNAWQEWFVTSVDAKFVVKTRWTSSEAWKEWVIESTTGTITVKTKWNGDDPWKEWVIYDNMPSEPANMKLASIFACVFSAVYLAK